MLASTALADEGPERVWSDTAELSFVITTGNTETLSLGLKNTLEGQWERSSFRLRLGALRSESTDEERFAVGDSGDFVVEKTSETDLTAEAYELAPRYQHRLGARNHWFVEAEWRRNEFAGFSNRYALLAGLATDWKDGERLRFRTDAALSWTKQDDVVDDPSVDDAWLGARFGWQLAAKIGQNAEYANDFVLDLNLDETEDLRLDMTNSLSVSFTGHLALKVSHRILFDNLPSLEEIDLFDPADLTTPVGKVATPLDEVDTWFNASLVVSF
jgi:putative salt-induced outer membrane protein YdiY